MKKFFTLITMMVLAIAANAEVKTLYSWESPEGTVKETGGTIAYVNGDGDRLNYPNGGYYTICLNGKKTNLADATASANAGHMVITFDEPLMKGDEITFTCYYNKGEQKNVSAWLVYENGSTASTERVSADIALGAEPEVLKVTVTEDGEGSNTLTLTRNDAGTNMFITKLVVTGERTVETPDEYTVYAKVTVDELSKTFVGQVLKVVEKDGVATVTLPAAVAGPYTMAEQKVKVSLDAEGNISHVEGQKLIFKQGANDIVVTVTEVYGKLAEGKIEVFVIAKGDNGKDVNVIYSSDEIVDPQPATRELAQDMFLTWNGFDESATVTGTHPYWDAAEFGTVLGGGGVVYGSGNVANSDYANLSGVDKVIIKGTPGTPLRWMMNRQADNSLTELNPVIGENGEVELDLTGYNYVHLNAIKIAWGEQKGAVDSITLVASQEVLDNIITEVPNVKAAAKAVKVIKYIKDGQVIIGNVNAAAQQVK